MCSRALGSQHDENPFINLSQAVLSYHHALADLAQLSFGRRVLLGDWAKDPNARKSVRLSPTDHYKTEGLGDCEPGRLRKENSMNSRLTRVLAGFVASLALIIS